MHEIAEIKIRNFRSCQEVAIPLAGYTPLVGYNNAGKSNIVRALEWMISLYTLQYSDFNDPEKPVSVEALIRGIDEEVLTGLGKHRARFEPHVTNGEIKVRTIANAGGTKKSDIKREALLTVNGVLEWHNPGGIPEALAALFPDAIVVPAMEDASADLSKSQKGTTIGKLIADIMEPLQAADGGKIEQALSIVRTLLADDGESRAAVLQEFDKEATDAMQDFFPGIQIKVEVPPPDIAEVFKTGRVKMSDSRGDIPPDWRDVSSHGHGAQRAAHMALIKLLAERACKESAGRKLLLIDEPELYLHPQMIESVRFALKKLAAGRYQVVFTTHSPLLIHREDVAQAVMVRKDGSGTTIRNTVSNCCKILSDNENQVETLLDLSNASQLLFCDRAILTEGKTERELMPSLIEKVLNTTMLSHSAALVVLSGCSGFNGSSAVLTSLGFQWRIIADLDFAFSGGIRMGILRRDDQLYKDCLTVISNLALAHGFNLETNGLPKNNGAINAEQAFNVFATSTDGAPLSLKLHNLFKANNVWVWPLGSIEYHLGMTVKGGDAIRDFRNILLAPGSDPEQIITDFTGVKEALKWALDLK